MKSRHLALVLLPLGLLAVACGDTTSTQTTQLNLDRPVDVAFACAGGLRITGGGGNESATVDQEVLPLSAQPLKACEIRSAPREQDTPAPVPPGQQPIEGGAVIPNARWYGLILQQGPGTVAIADFSTKDAASVKDQAGEFSVADADPGTPGNNSISIGEEPIGIITDTVGCSAITANAGSCDLSAMDLTTAFDLDGRVDIIRMEVKNGLGQPIRAKPAAIVAERKSEVIGDYCPSHAPGATAPVMAKGLAYIAYPRCHLVAGVDLATGNIVTGIQFSSAGAPSIVTDMNAISCPDECGIDTTTTPGPRPVTIDLEYDERFAQQRMVIGSENSNSVVVVELDDATRPLSIQQIALEGTVGVKTVAMSPVIGVGGSNGMVDDFALADYQYVYAIATDQTVRVLEVQTRNTECDTQVDPRFLRSGQDAPSLGCLPVGDPATPRRRAGARGPGIDLGPDQVPIGVDFFKNGVAAAPEGPTRMIGHFAAITSTTGAVFVVTVDDDIYVDQFNSVSPLAAPIALVLPHQLRDAGLDRSHVARVAVDGDPDNGEALCDPLLGQYDNGTLRGGPRSTNPVKNLGGFVAVEKGLQLPSLRQLFCQEDRTGVEPADQVQRTVTELGFVAPEAERDRAYPDWRTLAADEQVTLLYEGSLSQDRADTAANGPLVRESMLYVDAAGMHLRDQTRPFCDAGVEPFDIVQMRGCDPALASTDCPINYTCYVHPQSQVQNLGSCMLSNEAERLADACKDFLTSIRRYTVARSDSGELLLQTRRHELRATPLDGCVSDEQCETLGDLASRSSLATHPSDPVEQAKVDDRTWVCRADSTRPPRGVNNKRCNMSCDVTSQCTTGTVCVGGNEATPDPIREGLCMEGVVPPQSCVNAPQRYELRANESFVVVGARTGYVHPIEANASGQCVKPPTAHPYLTSRIPLDPPPCDPTADPISGRLPNGIDYEPNPCAYTTSHWETLPSYVPGTCTLGDPSSVVAERQAPAIKYRSRGLTFSIVDPYYPGDQTCITDRLGPNGMPLDRIPQVFHGYSMGFRVQGGFTPLAVPISPVFPVKVVRGPLQSIWVIDQGDFLSSSIGTASTRGKVFRAEAVDIGVTNVMQ